LPRPFIFLKAKDIKGLIWEKPFIKLDLPFLLPLREAGRVDRAARLRQFYLKLLWWGVRCITSLFLATPSPLSGEGEEMHYFTGI
jgi:hypothetical protein